MTKKIFTILSVEDNLPDFVLLKKALDAIQDLSFNIINISNGQAALDFIYKNGEYQAAPTPDLIILDINLPSISGQEILETLKKDDKYKVIPIVIFSTSDSPKDIIEAYRACANSYITKTANVKKLFKKIATLGEYWLDTNESLDFNNFCFIRNQIDP